MKNQEGFILPILIVLALVTLGIIVYFFAPKSISLTLPINSPKASILPVTSPDPATLDWKTLTLLNNTVSVKYPDSIYLEKDGSDNFAIALSHKGESQMDGGFRIDAMFTQQYSDFNRAIKETEIYFKPYKNFKKQTLQNGIVKMSGVLDTNVRVIALADYKGKAIVFDYLSQREKISPDVFDQILSTFRFVDDIQGVCHYGGKEYKVGEQFKALDGCNGCICEGTQVSCTEMACQ